MDDVFVCERVLSPTGSTIRTFGAGHNSAEANRSDAGAHHHRWAATVNHATTADALHAQLLLVGAQQPALRIEPLVTNAEPFCLKPEDRFKVWPTNRDRAAFNAVMAAAPPVDYDVVGHRGEKMVEAHRFFSEQAGQWLVAGGSNAAAIRAAAIETVVRELLQIVVIDLTIDENAQEIFETLNARGAQLTAADPHQELHLPEAA